MVHNLKDTIVSLHNFCGAAIDGMLGNNLGPGLFERFVDINGCPNAMGSAFHWVRRNAEAVCNIGLGCDGHGGPREDHRFHGHG